MLAEIHQLDVDLHQTGRHRRAQHLPTVADWESVFDEAGWELVRTNMIDMTVGEVIFELE